MHVAVVGASGNVGTALLRAIARVRPRWRVTGLARRVPAVAAGDAAPPYDVARWVAVDVGAPGAVADLTEAFDGVDAVVNLAWALQPSRDPQAMARTNLDGTRHVADAVRAAGVPHLVQASSLGAYSPAPDKPVVAEDWPTGGVPTSVYSRHKAAAERMLDAFEGSEGGSGSVVARLRPGLVLQRSAGGAIGRYFLGVLAPVLLPVARALPVLPLPGDLVCDAVHADDLAAAVVRILDRRAGGAFNVAADAPLTPATLAAALGARRVWGPYAALRTTLALSWHARLQPTDPGWLDLARGVPLMDTARARAELGWAPRTAADAALAELVDGMVHGTGLASPVLAPRD